MATPSNNTSGLATTTSPSSSSKPTIIGLYSISGSGKSYLMAQIQKTTDLADKHVVFYDGSALIDKVSEDGLLGFKSLSQSEKVAVREQAMDFVSKECREKNSVAFITGHLLFWSNEHDEMPWNVGVKKDWETYTHVIYLDVDADVIAERRANDAERCRPELSAEHLRKWKDEEKQQLRDICYQHGILFTTVLESRVMKGSSALHQITCLIEDFRCRDHEQKNAVAIEEVVNTVIAEQSDDLHTMLVLDGDKTLAPYDTGTMFWEILGADADSSLARHAPLNTIFKKQGYSFTAFRQAVLLYEEVAAHFDSTCDQVADAVVMYPEMKALLERVALEPRFGAVIVTCGLRHVWEKVLSKNGLSHVKVIGGGRLADGYVVTGEVKGDIVDLMHEKKLRVLAFGDSPLDINMMCKADETYIIVGEEASRSKSMDSQLASAIEKRGLSALQILLPKSATPRLDLNMLPKTTLESTELSMIFAPRTPFLHATDQNAAKLLMTATRHANNTGPALRQAHENMGYYLATSLVSSILGLEETAIPHVQGNQTDGYRFRHEKATLIVPLMRGGEPMAFGVSNALPLAGFAHAKKFSDIDSGNWVGKRTVILVDSVINTGKSIVEFMLPLRQSGRR